MKNNLFGMISIVLVGCSSLMTTEIKLNDGSDAAYIDCRMYGHRFCLEAASDNCPNGYDVIDERTNKPVKVGEKVHNTMIVKCK